MQEHRSNTIKDEWQELICRDSPTAVGWGLGLALVAAALFREQLSGQLLVAWLVAIAFAYGGWLAVVVGCRRNSSANRAGEKWERLLTLSAFLTGVLWGGASEFWWAGAPPALQLLSVILLLGVVVGTVPFVAGVRWGAWAFVLPATIPTAIRAFPLLPQPEAVAGVLLPLLVIPLLVLGRRRQGSTRRLLDLIAFNRELDERCRQSEARMAYAQRIAGFGEWEWDLSTGRIAWSDEVFRIYDFEPGQFVDRSILLYAIHPYDRAGYAESVETMIEGGPALDIEFRIVRPDGSVRYLRDVGEVVRDTAGRAVRLKGLTSDISDRVAAESKTRRTWRELNRVLENMQDTYFRVDLRGFIAVISRSAHSLIGYRSDELAQKRLANFFIDPSDWDRFRRALDSGGGAVQNFEVELRRKDGGGVWAALNAQHVLGPQAEVVGIEGVARDISELKQALDALYQEKERVLVTLQSIGDGVVTTDQEGKVLYLNPVAERLLGRDGRSARGQHYLELLSIVDEATGESIADLVKFCLTGNTTVVHAGEGRFIHPNGTEHHLKVTAAPMRNPEGRVIGAVLALHDITDMMGMAQQLSYQASHDILTGLANRQVFERRVEAAIRDAQTGGHTHVVLYLDLDQFKLVNDTCGHQAGDELLQQIAMLMQKKIRETDTLSRLGGDEFGVLLEHCPEGKAMEIAESIRQTIHDFRFASKDKVFDIGVSIGVVPIERSSASLAEVLSAADAACYVAKDHGRNRIHLYQLEDDAVARRHGEMEWVNQLSAAFDEDRFVLYAQPVVHLAGERLVSHYEILIRMHDDQGGLIPPMAFIPAAERYNVMPAIDRWVVRNTFQLLSEAQRSLAFPPVNCAINLSGQSLCDDHFLEYVVELFDRTSVPPESICFEITETAAIANLARATRFIQVMRDMGCSFALDDFGSGLSSFGYLKSLAVDFLKIDGSFVKNVAEDEVDRAMVESINQIGHVLGLRTIAEFVDQEESISVLEAMGVDYAQGYGIGLPKAFSETLRSSLAHIHGSVDIKAG